VTPDVAVFRVTDPVRLMSDAPLLLAVAVASGVPPPFDTVTCAAAGFWLTAKHKGASATAATRDLRI
jgi:hypothetical protein